MIEFERFFEMPCIDTFEMPKLRTWVLKQCSGTVLNLFGGKTRLNNYYPNKIIYNDKNMEIDADYHYDALEIGSHFPEESFDSVIFDPPYTMYQAVHNYDGHMIQDITACRNSLSQLLKPGGIIISLGYNSTGMGKHRGYKKTKILLVNNGASHNDIIILVEKKVQSKLTFRTKLSLCVEEEK